MLQNDGFRRTHLGERNTDFKETQFRAQCARWPSAVLFIIRAHRSAAEKEKIFSKRKSAVSLNIMWSSRTFKKIPRNYSRDYLKREMTKYEKLSNGLV